MLYVTLQSDVDLAALSQQLRASGIRQWLYLGEDSTWRVQAESAISSGIPRVSIADLLDAMSWKLRQPYIDWIGELSQLNHSLEWWASEIAAKNPFSMLYVRICLLAVARELITAGFDRPTLIVCSSPALLDEVVRFASGTGAAPQQLPDTTTLPNLRSIGKTGRRYLGAAYRRLRLFVGRLLGKDPRSLDVDPTSRRRLLTDRGVTAGADFAGEDAILLFTWVDHRNFSADGSYRDPHLGPLPEMLRERGYRVTYVPRVLHTIPFGEAVDRLLQTGERLFFPELFVADHEREAYQRRAQQFKPTIPIESRVGDVPVYHLAREHIEKNRHALAQTLTYESLIANLAASGVHPRQIIHTCEGHSWEQALAWSVRRHMPDTKVVGSDNGAFSRLALSMHPARNEYGLRPLPDRIVTNGPFHREILLAEGLPPEIVESGCALRHTYLWEDSACPGDVASRAYTKPIRILVATGIGFGESVELVAKAAEAFGGDPNYEIVVKCHPMVNTEQVAHHLGELAQHDNIQFVTTAVDELLPSAHVLLYTHTYVCFEALQNGVMPICVRADNFLNLDYLEAAPDVRWVATTPEDLRRVAEQISHMSIEERRRWQSKASDIVRAALAPVTPACVDAFLL